MTTPAAQAALPASHGTPNRPLQRSCLPCYHRKVKCSRVLPCDNCVKNGEECVFPSSRIRRTRKRKAVGEPAAATATAAAATTTTTTTAAAADAPSAPLVIFPPTPPTSVVDPLALATFSPSLSTDFLDFSSINLDSFASFPLFPSLQDEASTPWMPSMAELDRVWFVFQRNVDPFVRFIHKPTIEARLNTLRREGFGALVKAEVPLLLAICWAAVNSLDQDQQCVLMFGQEHHILIQRVSMSLDLAMAHSQWTRDHDIRPLQAQLIEVNCRSFTRNLEQWTKMGTVIRVAKAMGLHREKSHSRFSVLEQEMRRRVWWAIRRLEFMLSFKNDMMEAGDNFDDSDTAMPLNIDDADIDASMTVPPRPRQGPTEITFSLAFYHMLVRMSKIFREYLVDPLNQNLADVQSALEGAYSEAYQKYLHLIPRNSPSPALRLCAILVPQILKRMRIILWAPLFRRLGEIKTARLITAAGVGDDLFNDSVGLLEFHTKVPMHEDFKHWRWFLSSHRHEYLTQFLTNQINGRIGLDYC